MPVWRAIGSCGGFLLAVLVSTSPWILGSNRPLPWVFNAILAATALLAIVLHRLFDPQARRRPLLPIGLPVAPMGVALAFCAVQLVPLAPAAVTDPIWQYAPGVVDGAAPAFGPLSIDPHLTFWRLIRLATVGCVFLAAYFLARDDRWADRLVLTLLASAFLVALYGFFRLTAQPGKILWYDSPPLGRLGATFVNPNNAATYFGLAAIAALGLLLRQLRHSLAEIAGERGRYRLAAVIGLLPGWLGFAILGFLVPFAALLLTASRGAILATLVAFAALAGLQVIRRRRGSAQTKMISAGAAVLAVGLALIVLELSGAGLVDRLGQIGMDSSERFATYSATLQAIADHWLVGVGHGTFQDIFPLYRRESGSGLLLTWDKAHNDYLELALGLGLPVACLFLVGLAILFMRVLRGFLTRERNSHFAAIAVGSMILVALHAMVDFSLQIEAVAIAAALLVGVGAAQARSSRR